MFHKLIQDNGNNDQSIIESTDLLPILQYLSINNKSNESFIMFSWSITWTVAERKTVLRSISNPKCTDDTIDWLDVLFWFWCQWQAITLRQAWGVIIGMYQPLYLHYY